LGLRPQTGIVPQPVVLTPSLLFAPHPHSHHLQAQAATTKASALTKSATATAKEQLEVAKELAKREAELVEAEDMLDLFTKARAPATPPACGCAMPPANPNPCQYGLPS
jgi:hypothetical protein